MKKYKIALISPKGSFFENYGKYKLVRDNISNVLPHKNFYSGFSIGLLTIAALTPAHYNISLIDENCSQIDFNKKFDLVGITCMTQQATRAYQIGDIFKRKGIKVVIGGIHATLMPEEAKQHADSVIIGEGEEVWPELLVDFSNNNIKLFYKAPRLVDLSISPVPRYDLLNPKNYNVVWVQASRGCPIDCEFCAASKIYGFKFRHKGVKQVIDEIKCIIKLWGYNVSIFFADDNMFIDRKYALRLIEELRILKIRWYAQTDISIGGDVKFLRSLRMSGCSFLFIGFETLSKNGLRYLDRHNWKSKLYANYKDAIKKIQSCGIGILGSFILGLDTDGIGIFKRTADFVNNNHLLGAQVTILTPLPGTRLRERLDKEGRLLSNSWDNFTFLKANYIPKRMSVRELEEGLFKVYQWIYNEKTRIERIRYFKKIYRNLTKR